MMENKAETNDKLGDMLKELMVAPGLSGHEGHIAKKIESQWSELTDEITVSRIGSLHARKFGSGSEPRKSVLFAAHMDTIGLMVTEVIEGFLRVTEMGGLDPRVLPGLEVIVHGRSQVPGLIIQPPRNSLPDNERNGAVDVPYLLVDSGLSHRQLSELVRIGDLITFALEPFTLANRYVVGPGLDNRASIAALAVCLEELQSRSHYWDLICAATVQEEETLGGAKTSGFELKPEVAVAVDVTFGKAPGVPANESFALGAGPVNGLGPNIHPAVHKELKEAASRIEVPLKKEALPQHSGTDAITLQTAGEGIATGLISIPIRNMHTAVEMVATTDIRRAGRVLAEFVTSLEEDFLKTYEWD